MNAPAQLTFQELRSHFPDGRFDCHPFRPTLWMLRFELGGDHPNGSAARVAQSAARAGVLFRRLFREQSRLIILIEQWGEELRSRAVIEEAFGPLPEAELSGPCECCEGPMQARILEWHWRPGAVDRLLAATANGEQGFLPRLDECIWFFEPQSGRAFQMYDDRGCFVFLPDEEALQSFRKEHRAWLAKYQGGPAAWG